MAKTGDRDSLGTAEGAVLGRAAHALHAQSPVLDDTWAVELLESSLQAVVRDPAYANNSMEWDGFDTSPLFAVNVGSLRYAEDEVERCVRAGVEQYVILGAGFDTFALRRGAISAALRVYEVDHPDVQRLKRERIARAGRAPSAMPVFVPVDFESTSLSDGLAGSDFASVNRCVVSWMNTIPYLSASATQATLRELSEVMAAGSRVVLNYGCDVPLSGDQARYLQDLQSRVSQSGEPLRSGWKPDVFEALLGSLGFRVIEHATEGDLHARYFEGRSDGLTPGVPARLIVAER